MGNALSLGLGSALPPSRSCLGLLFYVLFILPRETEEFSVQESRVLALLPRRMKAAEQTGGNQRRLRPAGFPHRRPRCQLLHKLGPGLPPCKPSSHPAAGLSPRLIGEHLLAVLFLGFFPHSMRSYGAFSILRSPDSARHHHFILSPLNNSGIPSIRMAWNCHEEPHKVAKNISPLETG